MKTKYVVAFAFNNDLSHVALIRKNKPEWQKGKLNGVGGKIEKRETPSQAVSREFGEEAGIQKIPCNNWKLFCIMEGTNNDGIEFQVWCYAIKLDLKKIISIEEEKIEIIETKNILFGRLDIIENLSWLIPLAMDKLNGSHAPSCAIVEY